MKLKPAILSVLGRDDLKNLVDDSEIEGVDRRSGDGMRAAISRARRAKPQDLLGYIRVSQIKEVCRVMGVSTSGRRQDLIERLVNGEVAKPKQQRRGSMAKGKQKELDFNGDLAQVAARQKKAEKLTLARLERMLFQACDILRGNMDASEYKEYIFGMLFLKRMSDQFENDQALLRAEYEQKGLKPALIEKQLANPDKYDFYVPVKAHWSATDDKGRKIGIRPNDIVFSRRGELSRAAAISRREQGWLCGTGCFLLRASPILIDAVWLAYVYRYESVQRQVEARAVGSTMPSLNNAVMERLLVAFPPHQEQLEIGRRLQNIEANIRSQLAQKKNLIVLKTGLMQDLLTGKVRVKVDECGHHAPP